MRDITCVSPNQDLCKRFPDYSTIQGLDKIIRTLVFYETHFKRAWFTACKKNW